MRLHRDDIQFAYEGKLNATRCSRWTTTRNCNEGLSPQHIGLSQQRPRRHFWPEESAPHEKRQELRNCLLGWVTDAKAIFSKRGFCAAHGFCQAYLETAIKWISEGHIDDYWPLLFQLSNGSKRRFPIRALKLMKGQRLGRTETGDFKKLNKDPAWMSKYRKSNEAQTFCLPIWRKIPKHSGFLEEQNADWLTKHS